MLQFRDIKKGLGRQRTSSTRSASGGMPNLKPKDMTVSRMALFAPPFWLNRSQMRSLFLRSREQSSIDGVVRPVFEGLQDPALPAEGFPGWKGRQKCSSDGGGASHCSGASAHRPGHQGTRSHILSPARPAEKSFFDFFRRAAAADVHTESHPLELVVTRFRKTP
mgnify:CR=1 FL=1